MMMAETTPAPDPSGGGELTVSVAVFVVAVPFLGGGRGGFRLRFPLQFVSELSHLPDFVSDHALEPALGPALPAERLTAFERCRQIEI